MPISEFTFTDDEFLAVVNLICKKEINAGADFNPVMTMDENLSIDRLDSLGVMIFFIWISELFGISDDLVENFLQQEKFLVSDLKEFIQANCTKTLTYASIQEYVER